MSAMRTQERGRTTADRLLRATIDALVDLGYARTTTIEVVERSGSSRGALLHHFASRAELLTAAITRIAEEHEKALIERLDAIEPGERQFSEFVDAIWEALDSPNFYAALELWVAARTDEDLRSSLLDAERSVGRGLRRIAATVIDADRPGEFAIFEMTLALLRGLAVTQILRGDVRAEELIQTWKDMVVAYREKRSGQAPRKGKSTRRNGEGR